MYLQKDEAETATLSKLGDRMERNPRSKYFVNEIDGGQCDQERQRRENHNKSEKRRYSYINCKINELGNMLPEFAGRNSTCKRKGTILNETVEYMKKLQKDHEQLKQLESKITSLDAEFQRMVNRLQCLEMQPVSDQPKRSLGQIADNSTKMRATFDENMKTIPITSELNFTQKKSSTKSDFIANQMESSTQSNEINDICSDIISFPNDISTNNFEETTFSDTLINFF